MTTVGEAESAVQAAKARCDFLQQGEQETLGKLRAEQARLSTLLGDGADERALGKADTELQRLTNRLAGYVGAKQQAARDLEAAERALSEAVLREARTRLDTQEAEYVAAGRRLQQAFRPVFEAWMEWKKRGEERRELAKAAGVTAQDSRGNVLPRLLWCRSDIGDHEFRQWLMQTVEASPLYPLYRPPEQEA